MQMPINGISEEMLEEALKKAIENENYEMASHLRDELNRRKQGDNQTDATE
jgi:protein-arginine kinase activator protein McsA